MLSFVDHRTDPAAWARALGISTEAISVYLAHEVIDLHIDSFIWTRLIGYDLCERHGPGLFGARFYSQADLPRLREAQVGGGMWSVTTNPLVPSAAWRASLFRRNFARLVAELSRAPDDVEIVTTVAEYRAARARGHHAAMISVQGGNALDAPGARDAAPPSLLRVTLVHLSTSSLGQTSSPLGMQTGASGGLTKEGRDFVQALDARRIFVDLAHVNRRGFFDALEVHDRTRPVLVTHTGVSGVHPHWRNLDDEQLRAIADTGGTVGIMYQSSFLGDSAWGGNAKSVVDHLAHIVETVGEDHASLGSDWDGAIVTPRDMPTCLELPRLVDDMLKRRWTSERIGKILGGNDLRALGALRG